MSLPTLFYFVTYLLILLLLFFMHHIFILLFIVIPMVICIVKIVTQGQLKFFFLAVLSYITIL